MTAAEFLQHWRMTHINSGTQQSDVGVLVETLVSDAVKEGIDSDALQSAAGRPLDLFIIASLRTAIAEELW